MKTMILAAGLGTRLMPYTQYTPKSLFTLSRQPVIDLVINRLDNAGCEAITINTHHLHHKIEAFIATKNYTLPVHLKHEPMILGTGGAIKNASDFFDNKPFMLINSDIVTDIDLRQVYNFHLSHAHPVTMVMHDYPEFNNVSVDTNGCIIEFHSTTADKRLAFTGIHVIDPMILDFIPDSQFYSIIEAYRKVISNNKCIKAFIAKEHYWKDIGKPKAYKEAAFDTMAPQAFQNAYPNCRDNKFSKEPIQGDGSDRIWYRVSSDNSSIIVVDHGIRREEEIAEVDAFVNIGKHLFNNQLPVPEIFLDDTFSGLVFLEDLGSTHLQDIVVKTKKDKDIVSHYQAIIRLIGDFSISGAKTFNTSWTYQSTHYDKDLILEKEFKYFVEAFLQNYLGMDVRFDDLKKEFDLLADKTLEYAIDGLLHRDMQSRNIMVKNDKYFFIDFQGARLGPVQYDLASLIIDPYVALPFPIQSQLMDFCVETLSSRISSDKENFRQCLNYCLVTRNLQILGAFGYLSKVKGKKYFEQYIPKAVKTLKHYLSTLKELDSPALKSIIGKLKSSS
jgi:NDP-sugar pyrophosphorylase family protein